MARNIFIPEHVVEDFARFFSLSKEEINQLNKALEDPDNQTPYSVALDLMNRLEVNDDVAATLYQVYQYVTFAAQESNSELDEILNEIGQNLEERATEGEKVHSSMEDLRGLWINLFSVDSTERLAAKRQYLSSGLYNTVVDIQSVCDLRPVFDENRERIESFLNTVYLEVKVTDSTGDLEVIPLRFDRDAYHHLRDELDRVDRKLETLQGFLESATGGSE